MSTQLRSRDLWELGSLFWHEHAHACVSKPHALQDWPDLASALNPHSSSQPSDTAGAAQADPREPGEPVGPNTWASGSAPVSTLTASIPPCPRPPVPLPVADGRGPGPPPCLPEPGTSPEHFLCSPSSKARADPTSWPQSQGQPRTAGQVPRAEPPPGHQLLHWL